MLYQYAADESHSAATRALAVRMLPAEAELPTSQELAKWIESDHDRTLGLEVVRLLAQRTDRGSLDVLAALAGKEATPRANSRGRRG